MYVNLETAFAATRAEQHLADLRATKLGPLLAEAERGSAEATTRNSAAPPVLTSVRRLIQQRRLAWLNWARRAAELRPSAGR